MMKKCEWGAGCVRACLKGSQVHVAFFQKIISLITNPTWMNNLRVIPEFKILRLTFNRKLASMLN